MLICCWSSKGGSGTTVVASALAVVLNKASPSGTLIVDLAGDVPAVLGLPDGAGDERAGVAEWLGEGALVPADGLARVEVRAQPGLALLPAWSGPAAGVASMAFASMLAADPRTVVVDGGSVGGPGRGRPGRLVAAIAAEADHSLLVVRPCFLALRRALHVPVRPTGVVLVTEDGRALDRGRRGRRRRGARAGGGERHRPGRARRRRRIAGEQVAAQPRAGVAPCSLSPQAEPRAPSGVDALVDSLHARLADVVARPPTRGTTSNGWLGTPIRSPGPTCSTTSSNECSRGPAGSTRSNPCSATRT